MQIIVRKSKDSIPLPSREEQRRLEKKGYFFATAREIHEAAEKGRKQQEKEFDMRCKKFMSEKIEMINHGHSCIQELKEQVKNGQNPIQQ